MSTYQDVLVVIEKVDASIKRAGCTEEFDAEVRERFRELGEAILADQGLQPDELAASDPGDELPDRCQALFDNFKLWLSQQPESEINDIRPVDFRSRN